MADIEIKSGDLFKSGTESLVNTVNCVGVMGRGIALQFKKAYPRNFQEYVDACSRNQVQPGRMFVHETGKFVPRYIINFPTKRHWRGNSRLEDIDSGLEDLAHVVRQLKIKSIAIPPLGAGLGGLSWDQVRPRIEAAFNAFDNLNVVIFEPKGAPEIVKTCEVPKMTVGRASLVSLMNRYLDGLLDPFVTLIEVQKLMYFMQLSGQQLRLNYQKGPYGPYAQSLRHVLNKVEGHFVSGYKDGGDQPFKELTIVPGAIEEARNLLVDMPDVRKRLGSVADLVEGFESPHGLELLATVHWVAAHEGAQSADEALQRVYNWSPKKQKFSDRQIHLAYDRLNSKSWLCNENHEAMFD